MSEAERVKELIRRAFAAVERPADGALHESDEGDEGPLVESEFAGRDWRTLDGAFLDDAPAGYGSALSFFSPAALRYFLPAYLIADLDGQLERVDVAWRLSAHFTDAAKGTRVNPQRYGELTRFDSGKERYAGFSREQVAAIVAYLESRLAAGGGEIAPIREALANYWRPRLAGSI